MGGEGGGGKFQTVVLRRWKGLQDNLVLIYQLSL